MSNSVPDGWQYNFIGDIATVFAGGTPSRANTEYYVGSNPWVKSGEVNARQIFNTEEHISDLAIIESSAKWAKAGSVLVAMYGATAGQVAKLMIDATLNQAVSAINGKDDLAHNDYLLYSIEYNTDELLNTVQGSGQPNLSGQLIKSLKIPLPPLPEQKKIAAILTSVDTVIEKTQAQIDKLKDLKTGMMQELLTKGIGHTEFKDSPVGRIPVEWEVATLGESFSLLSGSTPSRKDMTYFSSDQNAIPWVKTLDLNDEMIKSTDEKITERAIKNSSCKKLPIGTALIAMYGGWNQIGRSGVLSIEATTNQAICALKFKGNVLGTFANYWLISNRMRWKTIAASSRKDPNITKQDVSDFLIAIPSLKEQESIIDRLDSATHIINLKCNKLISLKKIKKALMQDLLTGKVRVKL